MFGIVGIVKDVIDDDNKKKKKKKKEDAFKKNLKNTQNQIKKCMRITNKNCSSPFSDNTKIKKCPVMFTNTSEGKKCMSLYNDAMARKKKYNTYKMWDSAFEMTCQKPSNTNLYACKCLNAGKKGTSDAKVFNALNQGNVSVGDVYCWYRYCKEPSDQQLHTIFLPRDYRHFNKKSCPAVKCANILNIKDSNIDTSRLKQSFSCSGDIETKESTPYDSPETNESSDSSLRNNNTGDEPTHIKTSSGSQSSFFRSNMWIIVLIIFITVVVFGLFLFFLFR